MPDRWIMFGSGSGSVIAACLLYQNMVPGQWIPFSNTDKQQDDEDKGQCWHQVWKLESWMILPNILGPAHGGLQLLNTLSIWLFSRPLMTNLGVGHVDEQSPLNVCFEGFAVVEMRIPFFWYMTYWHRVIRSWNLMIGPHDCLQMRMLYCLETMGSNYPFLDHHIPEK